MSLDTIPTQQELIEKYREYAHKCVLMALKLSGVVTEDSDYIGSGIALDMVMDGTIKIATEKQMKEARRKVQEVISKME